MVATQLRVCLLLSRALAGSEHIFHLAGPMNSVPRCTVVGPDHAYEEAQLRETQLCPVGSEHGPCGLSVILALLQRGDLGSSGSQLCGLCRAPSAFAREHVSCEGGREDLAPCTQGGNSGGRETSEAGSTCATRGARAGAVRACGGAGTTRVVNPQTAQHSMPAAPSAQQTGSQLSA